jgi:hypothetical protein
MPPAGFEPAIIASESQQTTPEDRAVTGIGECERVCVYVCVCVCHRVEYRVGDI